MHPMCVDCGAQAPDTNTNFTLISSAFGWRLRKVEDRMEWRCPACWRAHKLGAAPTGTLGPQTSSAGGVQTAKRR
jgi:hypothetical protein